MYLQGEQEGGDVPSRREKTREHRRTSMKDWSND